MKTATTGEVRRIERDRDERALLHAIAVAAGCLVDNIPGATFRTLEVTVIAWREWDRRQRGGRS